MSEIWFAEVQVMRDSPRMLLIVGLILASLGGCPSVNPVDSTAGQPADTLPDTRAGNTAAQPVAAPDGENGQTATADGGATPEPEPPTTPGNSGAARPPASRQPDPGGGQPSGGNGAGTETGASGSTTPGETGEPGGEPEPPGDPVGEAVDRMAEQLLGACRALTATSALADARLVLNANTSGEFGYCPTIRFACSFIWSLVAIDFEYTGCSSAATAGLAFAGNLAMYIARDTGWAEMEYCEFTIEHKAVTGHIDAYVAEQPDGVEITGTGRVATQGLGECNGDLRLRCHEEGWYSFSANRLTLAGSGWSVDAALASLIVDPPGNQSFVPDSGTVTFAIANPAPPPEFLNIKVEFTDRSPIDGTVWVSVNGGPPFEHKIPGSGP